MFVFCDACNGSSVHGVHNSLTWFFVPGRFIKDPTHLHGASSIHSPGYVQGGSLKICVVVFNSFTALSPISLLCIAVCGITRLEQLLAVRLLRLPNAAACCCLLSACCTCQMLQHADASCCLFYTCPPFSF